MHLEPLRHIALFILLVLLQVLVLNHIHLFGVATPLLYIYFILSMRRDYPRWALLVWAFALGLLTDTFQNTPGVGAASLTLLACLRPNLLQLFITREMAEDLIPSSSSLGRLTFFYYSAIASGIFCVTFFTLEMFSFFNVVLWLQRTLGSLILTMLLVMAADSLRRKRDRKE